MEKDTRITEKVKSQIERFAHGFSVGLDKAKRRFISQMLFGIQAARDIKISNISRSLNEEIKLIKTENRLSRNAWDQDLTSHINEELIKDGPRRIRDDTVLAIDLSDIQKPFAKKMEYLARVWDGSESKVGSGYWICEVTAAEVKGEEIVPLYSELYSQEAKDFKSENEQIIRAVKEINEKTRGRGIWVIDRGGDRRIIVDELGRLGLRFVIRISGKRNLVDISKEEQRVIDIARRLYCSEKYVISVDREGYQTEIEVNLGRRDGLSLGGVDVSLVVIKGFSDEPMLLLTNAGKGAKEILEIYLTRWKCEESFRFLKQEYHLEDVRVRRYVSLRNAVVLLHAVFYFLSVYLGRRLRMTILLKKILEKAKRFFQMPIFKQYAIADGIYRILFNAKWGLREKIPKIDMSQQMFDFAMET